MNITIKDIVVFVSAALAQLATMTAMCLAFGPLTGVLAVFIALLISLLAAVKVSEYMETDGYDIAVAATAKSISFVKGLFA